MHVSDWHSWRSPVLAPAPNSLVNGRCFVDHSHNKIRDAVETCLAFAVGNADPFSRVAAYLRSLRDDGDWSDAEVIEVQVHVIRALMKRIGPAQGCSSP